MSTSQRLLLVIVLLLAGGALAGALLLGDEGSSKPTATGPGPVVAEAPAPAPRADLGGPKENVRVSAEGDPTGVLEVRVLNEQGAAIPADVLLTGPEGQIVQAEGSTTWKEFPIGSWEFRANTENLVAYHKNFEVVEGETTLITSQLLQKLKIKGKVIDRFGQAVGRANIWFMRRDQAHPSDNAESRKVQTVTTDTRGTFRAELDKKGHIRMSVGKPGKKVIESEPIFFSSGGPTEITIVVDGTGNLEVEIENPPPALAEGKANLLVTVLAERNERSDGPNKRRTPGTKRKSGKEETGKPAGQPRNLRGGRDTGGSGPGNAQGENPGNGKENRKGAAGNSPTQEGLAGVNQNPGRNPELDWTVMQEAYLSPKGILSFKALPPDRDLIVMVTRRGDRFRSRPFRLSPDRASLVRFLTPVKRSDEEQDAEVYGELEVQVQVRPLPQDAPSVGFTLE